MYVVDLVKRLLHKNNLPVLIYLILNVFVSAIFGKRAIARTFFY